MINKISRLSDPKEVLKMVVMSTLGQVLVMGFIFLFVIMATVAVFDNDSSANGDLPSDGHGLSAEVLAWEEEVRYWAEHYDISDWVWILLAIMEVETRGLVPDLMQSSESAGLPPNTLEYEDSIEQGVRYLSQIISRAQQLNLNDRMAKIQSYNFGIAYINWLSRRDEAHSIEIAAYYSRTVVAPSLGNTTGERYDYRNAVSVANGKPWLYVNGGNFHYADLVMNALGTSGGYFRDGVVLPLDPPFRITCDFYCYEDHGGIDLSAYFGASVRSIMDGTVIHVVSHHDSNGGYLGHVGGWGNVVFIRHEDDIVTVYAHLTSNVRVGVGDQVNAGQIIGYEGNSGNSSGHHLHLEWRENGVRINPALRIDFSFE